MDEILETINDIQSSLEITECDDGDRQSIEQELGKIQENLVELKNKINQSPFDEKKCAEWRKKQMQYLEFQKEIFPIYCKYYICQNTDQYDEC